MNHDGVAPPVFAPQQEIVADQAAAAQVPAPTPEQVHAADRVFALPQDQGKALAALLGLQGAVLLGHQLLVETFERSEEEDDKQPKPRPGEPEGAV
jgi:hypothetical protein